MYDLIGDVHGYADELEELLRKLGYEDRDGSYRHRSRRAIFVGDLIDRGPRIADSVRIVKDMTECDAALCVMGNHEFNALAFHTAHPNRPGEFLRPHSAKNIRQHQATLDQLSDSQLTEALEWFRGLPCWLELPGLRVVHACWSPADFAVIAQHRPPDSLISADFLFDAVTEGTPLFDAIETVLKGPEAWLPGGMTCADKDGHRRRKVRLRWFTKPVRATWDEMSFGTVPELRGTRIPAEVRSSLARFESDGPPVFFGHYWLDSVRPTRRTRNAACLDFSVAKGGRMTAYRFDGESEINDDKFVWVETKTSRGT